MLEVNLLDSYPKTKRPIAEREAASARTRDIAKRFGAEYFDGDRTEGYGGYRYDGRWVPIAKRIGAFYQLRAGDRVLDVGCAKGFLLHDLQMIVPGIEVVGLDVSEYALAHAMDTLHGRLVRGTAAQLPFPGESFDLVIAINAVHNLTLPLCRTALREIERVSCRHKYVQVDSFLTEKQRIDFERWQLTAETYFDPVGWRRLFDEADYTGDYYWTVVD